MKIVYWGIWILNIESLENRFNQNGLEYYEALLQVLILDASKKNFDTELKKVLEFYNNERSHDFDVDTLKTQLHIFSKNFPFKAVQGSTEAWFSKLGQTY